MKIYEQFVIANFFMIEKHTDPCRLIKYNSRMIRYNDNYLKYLPRS